MKKVEAILRTHKLDEVKSALTGGHGHDRHRSPRLWPAEGPRRSVPRR